MGNIYSLDVNNGALVWTAPFANNSPHGSLSKIALLNNTVYLSTSKALWALNKTTGMELGVEPFDHYVQPITSADNKLFVVADLYVIAYTDFGSTNTYPPQLTNILPYTIPICIIFLVIIILMLRLYYRKKHANTCGQSLP
jgi:hypothetical protein